MPAQRSPDPWFWSHYNDAASIFLDLVPRECLGTSKQLVDFGCGDGATALGVASRIAGHVTGVDLYKTFLHLPDNAERSLGVRALPGNLSFLQNELGKPLPLPDGSADLIYSWSVFEHLADPAGALAEFGRIAKAGAILFIQIDPLFYSPFGSHLQRLVDEPWAHLRYPEEEYLARAAAAVDCVPTDQRDTLYRTNAFEDLKRHLIREYRALNRITVTQLLRLVVEAGFEIQSTRLIEAEGLEPPPGLLQLHSRDVLMTSQVVIVAARR